VTLRHFENKDDEVQEIWSMAKRSSVPGSPSVILLPRHDAVQDFASRLSNQLGLGEVPKKTKERNYEEFNEFWRQYNINFEYFGNGTGALDDSDKRPMVYVMTYHSSKGLDFPSVYIPYLSADQEIAWDKLRQQIPDIDRKLLYVASTRSRGDLCYSYSGDTPNYYLQEIINSHLLTEGKKTVEEPADDDGDDFF
jgi:superfamily I DNA/RNA helicase